MARDYDTEGWKHDDASGDDEAGPTEYWVVAMAGSDFIIPMDHVRGQALWDHCRGVGTSREDWIEVTDLDGAPVRLDVRKVSHMTWSTPENRYKATARDVALDKQQRKDFPEWKRDDD